MKEGNLSIAIISRSTALGGGASRIAEELAEWLLAAGYSVGHYCADPASALKDFQSPLFPSRWLVRLARLVNRSTRRLGFNEVLPIEFLASLRNLLKQFSILHFHDLNTAISPTTLRLCSKSKPVVFTAHDCSSFTGGCIYPSGCARYARDCGGCPQLRRIVARFDFTSCNLKINRTVARLKEVQYVFPSKWLLNEASRSLEFGRK